MTVLNNKLNVLSVISAILNFVFVKKETLKFVFSVKENLFISSLIMTQVPSFLRKAVPAFHLEPEQTPAFKAWTSMTIYPRLMIIQFLLTTPEEMNSIVSKLQMILEQGHQKYQEMLAGHVPISMGILKGAEHPLLILQNVSSRTFKLAVIDSMKTVGLVPTKILTQLNRAKVVDLYQNNNQTPRFLEDVILGVLHVRQVFHQGQLDLVGAQAEIQVPPRPNKWYMVMTESKHLNLANILKTKAQLEQDAAPVPQKRSNPYQVIQKIKKARENQSTTGPTTNAPKQQPTTQEEEDWGDNQELIQILNDSGEQAETPSSSLQTTQEMNIHTLTSSLRVLLEAVRGACDDALHFFNQPQSK